MGFPKLLLTNNYKINRFQLLALDVFEQKTDNNS